MSIKGPGDPAMQALPIKTSPVEPVREMAMSRLLAVLEEGMTLGGGSFDRNAPHGGQ